MDTNVEPVEGHAAVPEALHAKTPAPETAVPTAAAFVADADSEGVVRHAFTDVGFLDARIVRGNVDSAVTEIAPRNWPHFLIVDVSGIGDPLPSINRLAEVCDPKTEVIVVGDRNDIVLYRDLKAAGVAEYFYKPLVSSLLARTLGELSTGTRNVHPSRSGKLIFVLGVRGGVGATTIATNLAWHFAEVRQRGVLLLDLDLHGGDAALHFGAQPGHALREALADPKRIDELFLERGVISVSNRLGLLAALEPFTDRLVPNEEAALNLVGKIVAHFRYVVVDLSAEMALACPGLLRMPSTLVLVSDGSLTSIREVGRWLDYLGPKTPDRSVLFVLNKYKSAGALPDEEMLQVVPKPDVAIRWDREIMNAATLGTKAVQECGAIRDGMEALSIKLSGATADDQSLWKRIFG